LLLSHISIYRRKHGLGKGLAEIGAGEIEVVTSPTRTREREDGYGKSPAGRRFQKGQSGNPCGPCGKNLAALLVATLKAPALATTDRCRRQATGDGCPAGQQIEHGRFARNQDAARRAEEGRTEGLLGPCCSMTDKDDMVARIVPLYAARIEDLGPGDFVKADCASCGHTALLVREADRLALGASLPLAAQLAPRHKVLDLKDKVRCWGCGARGRAVVSVKLGKNAQPNR
jgi:bacterioferritin-associated ferredoxin